MSDARGVVDHSVQSPYSDPGEWSRLFDDVEPTIEGVSAMARNVIAHYRARADALPVETKGDINCRWVEAILATDQARHAKALTTERALAERVQGCCRDHTLLAVAALRHHGIPARSRVGFASYLSPTWHHDHVIVDAWLDGRWRRFDPEFAPAPQAGVTTGDIPHGPGSPFLTAAQVWQGHRNGALDVTRFGVAEGLPIAGDWFVHAYVIQQVAHRFGEELLLWDQWGAMTGDLASAPAATTALVDDIAELLVRADDGDLQSEWALLARYREDDRLHPGSRIRSYDPDGHNFEVDLMEKGATAL